MPLNGCLDKMTVSDIEKKNYQKKLLTTFWFHVICAVHACVGL